MAGADLSTTLPKKGNIMRKSTAAPLAQGALLASVLASSLMAAPAMADDMDADEDAESRRTIIVTGERDADANPNANDNAAYKVEKSADGKFTEEVRDTPKSVTIIPKEVLEDIGANSFREVVRSTPGVTLGTGEGGNAFGDRIFIRGFEARNDVYIDGLRDPGVSSREIFAVEQIEIVKGPSGSFGGRGTTGGLVSLYSKQPFTGSDFLIAEGQIGTENHYRGQIDGNWAVSDDFAIRINGLYHSADTPGRDYVDSERKGGAIAAAWQATDTLKLSADYYILRVDGMVDFGHPFDATTSQPYKVDRDNFYGVVGRDFLENKADIGTFRIDFVPIDDLKIRSISRYGETANRYLAGTPSAVCRVARTATGACPAGGTNAVPTGVDVGEANYTVTAGGQRRDAETAYFAQLIDATANIDTFGIGHTIVFGGEYAHEKVDAYSLATAAYIEDANGNQLSVSPFVRNLLNPDPVLDGVQPVFRNPDIDPTQVTVETASVYLIDTIEFSPQFSITLGGRYDAYRVELFNPDSSTAAGLQPLTLVNNVGFLNYQASAVYKPVEALTFYASYATSSNPSGEQIDGNGIAYDGLAVQTANLEPERNTSYELGAKWELNDGDVLLTAAAFQITKENARENIGGNVYELVGELRSRGVELGVNGNITDWLQLFGGYTYTDATIRNSVNTANIGRRFANIPRHSASLLAMVSLNDHVQLGGQVHVQDAFYGGSLAAGSAKVPGYARFDAVARWKPRDDFELRVNVLNLTDKVYYDAIYRSGAPFAYIAPGRSATLTASYTF